MSRYRIKVKPVVIRGDNGAYEPSEISFPEYKLWGLFWIPIRNEHGSFSFFCEISARREIEKHKILKEIENRIKVRIIEIKG
jgi:hypothetical protein